MSKHHLRKEHNCENCGYPVEKRFCTACGQENIETRQSFGHLVKHFAEDFTHYEGNVWKTVKYLLFRPAYLTKTYLAGKRMQYVAPVKLYIFISFVAFFLPGLLPHLNTGKGPGALKTVGQKLETISNKLDKLDDSLQANKASAQGRHDSVTSLPLTYADYRSVEEYDSIQHTLPESKRDGLFDRYYNRKMAGYNKIDPEVFKEKFNEKIAHNFPKALFFYLPLFAFVLWLFHGKKKWLYFDHAIFTLHYFSFLLLLITIRNIVFNLIPWYFLISPGTLSLVFGIIIWLWSVFYFYRGHRRLYEESRAVSRLKATFILFINSIVFLAVFLGFIMLTLLTVQ